MASIAKMAYTRAGRRHAWARGAQRGQGLVEYAFILLLVALVVFGVLLLIGPTLGSIFSQVTPAL
ncbi:MAG TPA: hypothetical protein VIC85_12550 [Ktedonobacterales bacterium]|jgi:pilus assembly protein Flp/PilA